MLNLLAFGFRRRNRPVLVKVLARVFRKAIYHRFDVGGVSPRAELEEDLRRLAAEQLDILRHVERQLSFVDKGR